MLEEIPLRRQGWCEQARVEGLQGSKGRSQRGALRAWVNQQKHCQLGLKRMKWERAVGLLKFYRQEPGW